MAGQVKPTFLATPISSSRSSSFGDKSEKSCCSEKGEKLEEEKQGNSPAADGVDDHAQSGSTSQQSSSQETQNH
ncbi:hypothetical protein COLO4_16091 [Corchorus olitorius]|uniref:Uncharacterized protein n=1 Tax=Corchorus olitorius TaxID=93759 RepID=A0A1R3JJS6_9ROSI|nr:hypothetical protein COLO4_16091 [Corchorus olitorius]